MIHLLVHRILAGEVLQVKSTCRLFKTACVTTLIPMILVSVTSNLGCQQSTVGGRPAVEVSGTVTFDGDPIEIGTLFMESDDAEQRGFSAPIKNGTYSIQVEPGPKKVQITASRPIPGRVQIVSGPDGMAPQELPVYEMYIPEKYNSKTELRFQVENQKKQNSDFAISSKD
ncbi:MAG TPA: hypothetical protein VNQ76_12835 [Planctomicrobium sp.]|nr:hypothetical protein [Planctomicrobium sp.]